MCTYQIWRKLCIEYKNKLCFSHSHWNVLNLNLTTFHFKLQHLKTVQMCLFGFFQFWTPDLNLTMWWLVLVSQRKHSEVTQGCWWWPGTLGWVEWAPLVPQLWEEAKHYLNHHSLCLPSHTYWPVCPNFMAIFWYTVRAKQCLTHQERWQMHSPSGNQIHWMRYTGRQHWTLIAHC